MMDIVLGSLAFLLSALFVGVMGFAIQRGATCTVAAVGEVVERGSFWRVFSLIEAALWVAGGLLVAQALHVLPRMPAGYQLNGWTVLGAVLLGLGAFVNGACVFGAIALFGSGRWAQLFMPAGFFLGCASLNLIFAPPARAALPYGSPVLQAPGWVAVLFLLFVAFRLGWPLLNFGGGTSSMSFRRRLHQAVATHVWSPHAATTVIGVTFFFSLMLVGAWAYTDLLADLARGKATSLAARCLLALALLLGAAWGGWTAGRFKGTRITLGQVLRALAGGTLMGWGTLLIPGSNDALILIGMPLLWPYAWVAFLTMFTSIAAVKLVARLGSPRRPGKAEGGQESPQ
ncbi:MAG TPA: YeeE/YedE thiosulfate transporter family protein [Burkholderiaceae bacterium]|nr:YeeE/YedE thiosulfate transporter family protein [Burkholderiaceae bacterium]